MKLAHIALWTRELDAAAVFWQTVFGATVGAPYRSQRRPGFVSRFAVLPGGVQIELMTGPWIDAEPVSERSGWDHVAISLGSQEAVDAMAARCRREGRLVSGPRTTGDGFYEAVLAMPDGTRIEVTA